MTLTVEDVGLEVEGQDFLREIRLTLEPGRLHVLLGRTLAGKTSLLRVLAGLVAPTRGRVCVDGVDMAGVPLGKRNIAFVYEQFVNYPAFTVAENIAAPLRRAGMKAAQRQERVQTVARQLRIDHLLHRLPAELSGGQQQRVAIARALAKDAPLLLLDEPLVNLDYKLREELRSELRGVLAGSRRIVVYTTTEPHEAVQMGGDVTVLHEGRVLQSGPAAQVYARPANVQVAQLFSDPPMNIVPAHLDAQVLQVGSHRLPVPQHLQPLSRTGSCQIGVRPCHLRLAPGGQPAGSQGPGLLAQVTLAEVNGSETYLHARSGSHDWVLHLDGIHSLPAGTSVEIVPDASRFYLYGSDGGLLATPPARAQVH